MPNAAGATRLTYSATIQVPLSVERTLDAIGTMNKMQPMPGYSRQGNNVSVFAPLDWHVDNLRGQAPGVMQLTATRTGANTCDLAISLEADIAGVPEDAREMVAEIFEQFTPQLAPQMGAAIEMVDGLGGSGLN